MTGSKGSPPNLWDNFADIYVAGGEVLPAATEIFCLGMLSWNSSTACFICWALLGATAV